MCVPCSEGSHEMKVSPGLSLVHVPGIHRGKTSSMDKGLFLCARGRLCAGESAGLGVPVWKTRRRTFFPAPSPVTSLGTAALQKKYRIDRLLQWHVNGIRIPPWVSLISEYLVDAYMKRASIQGYLLKMRDAFFSALLVSSSMEPGRLIGTCIVTYEPIPEGLRVHVDSRALPGKGKLIMLNELDGASFNSLRIKDLILMDKEVPAWKEVSFDAVFESPTMNLGFTLSPGEGEDPSAYRVFCGRELGFGLDWAGIAIMNRNPVFSYRIGFSDLVS